MPNFELHLGDCLELMKALPAASVDLILCDLPYGTTSCKWDSVLPLDKLWAEYRRIAKPSAAMILTASQPFTTALISSNMREFKYCWVWDKKASGNPGLAKYQPLKIHEDIVVFGAGGKARYMPIMAPGRARMKGGKSSSGEAQSGRLSGYQYESSEYYPKSILEFSNAGRNGRLHPTQKPIALMEYLVRTYTNEGDLVLDNCMGSGTTGVACANTGRRFVGMEMDPAYFAIARDRILAAQPAAANDNAEPLAALA